LLRTHPVRTAAQQGWDKLRNVDLLRVAAKNGLDLILTTDRNLGYQQNLEARKIPIIVLKTQQWPRLQPYVQAIVDAIDKATHGTYTEVTLPLQVVKNTDPIDFQN